MFPQTSLMPASPRWVPDIRTKHDLPRPCQLTVRWANCEEDVRQAQSLRHQVFVREMGANLHPLTGCDPELDADRFDPFCDHLLVEAMSRDVDSDGLLVGTYRVLPPDAARRAGGLYIDTEFDLAPLAALRQRAVELGRSCVHPSWRTGGVILALWTALCQYMFRHQLETMIGCASIGLADGGQGAARLWQRLQTTHLVDAQWQVQPRQAFPLSRSLDESRSPDGLVNRQHVPTPPLIKGYLRCGARLLGPPALDPAFNTADLPMMLRVHELAPRYRKHFMGA